VESYQYDDQDRLAASSTFNRRAGMSTTLPEGCRGHDRRQVPTYVRRKRSRDPQDLRWRRPDVTYDAAVASPRFESLDSLVSYAYDLSGTARGHGAN